MPQKNCEAKDEMNLAEFPLCALAHRLKPEVKTLRFEDRVWDKGRNDFITRQLTITGSDAYGLPTELDDEILLGLIQITRQRGFIDRKVPFTRHELIRMLDWRDDTKSYQRIEASLNRWMGVTLYYNKAWWSKERQCWLDAKFHVLDNVWLCHRNEPAPDTGLPGRGAPMSAFVWNEVIFRSFTHGNLKSIDFEFFKSLEGAVAKRLYRFLDKRFFYPGRKEFDLTELCCEHIGLSRNHDTSNLKRKLMKGIEELEQRNFLQPMSATERFRKIRAREWQVVFERATRRVPKIENQIHAPVGPMAQKLIDKGVSEHVAQNLVASYPEERIKTQLECFDKMIATKGAKPPRNPAGFLVSSIKHEYKAQIGLIAPCASKKRTGTVSMPRGCVAVRSNSRSQKISADNNEQEKRIEQFWELLSNEERTVAESLAFSDARPIEREVMERGGPFASAARKAILDSYANKILCEREVVSNPPDVSRT